MPTSIDDLRRMAAVEPNLALRSGYLAALVDAERLHKGGAENSVSNALLLIPRLTEALDDVLGADEKVDPASEDFAKMLELLRGLKVRVEEVLHDHGQDTVHVYQDKEYSRHGH